WAGASTVNSPGSRCWIIRRIFARLSRCGSIRTSRSSAMRRRRWVNGRSRRERFMSRGIDLWSTMARRTNRRSIECGRTSLIRRRSVSRANEFNERSNAFKSDQGSSQRVSHLAFDRRTGTLRTAFLLRFHGEGVRLVDHSGHIRERIEQAYCWPTVWIRRRVDHRSFRSPKVDDRRNPYRRHSSNGSELDVGPLDVLLLLFSYCARLPFRL